MDFFSLLCGRERQSFSCLDGTIKTTTTTTTNTTTTAIGIELMGLSTA